MLEKNLDKLKKKNKKGATIVEDDFVTPNDFRDPGGRKRDGSDSEASINKRKSVKDQSPLAKTRNSDGRNLS